METIIRTLTISSAAFEQDGNIPSKYTCQGANIHPSLRVEQLPAGTKSLALIAEDPDAPGGTFDHWLVWNIDPATEIEEDSLRGSSGTNSAGKTGYYGPCPPSGSHRYYFRVFALDDWLDLPDGAGKKELVDALQPHVLAQGSIMARYEKSRQPE